MFSPKLAQSVELLLETLAKLYGFGSDFVSCTYAAGGTNKGCNIEICEAIKKSGKIEVTTHFTCIGSSTEDIVKYLNEYIAVGAGFLMTQLCHDVAAFEEFVKTIRRAHVTLPVVVGLMPVLAKDSIIRMSVSNGSSIPKDLAAIIGKYGNNSEDFNQSWQEFFRLLGGGSMSRRLVRNSP